MTGSESVMFWNLGKQEYIWWEIPSPPNSFILKKKKKIPEPVCGGLGLDRKGSDSKGYLYTHFNTGFKWT